MPKLVKRRTPAKKTATLVKSKSKSRPVKVAKVKPRSFMWELLKRKEAERLKITEERKNGKESVGRLFHMDQNNYRYSRFVGPRRRAG